MSRISLIKPVVGQPSKTEDPKVTTALTEIESVINGNLDATNITESTLSEALLTPAVKTLINAKASGFTVAIKNETAVNIAANEFVSMEKVNSTATGPAAAAGKSFGVAAGPAATGITVQSPSGEKFYGDFLTGSTTSFELTSNQHVTLTALSSTVWLVTAGEPLNATKYIPPAAITLSSATIPSATRDTEVVLTITSTGAGEKCGVSIKVNAVLVTEFVVPAVPSETSKHAFSFLCPVNQKFTVTSILGSPVVTASYLFR